MHTEKNIRKKIIEDTTERKKVRGNTKVKHTKRKGLNKETQCIGRCENRKVYPQ